jgi:hypothetical protein
MTAPEYMAVDGLQINNYLLQFFITALYDIANVNKFYYLLSISETELVRSKNLN